jgi:hypothetical protein
MIQAGSCWFLSSFFLPEYFKLQFYCTFGDFGTELG